MNLIQLRISDKQYIKEAAELLKLAFPNSYSECAEEEVLKCLEDEKVVVAAIDNNGLIGFVGAMPQYGTTGWELHPLVVSEPHRSQGIGSKLCYELEKILKGLGCITIYLGSDDETGSTTLSNTNLFEDTFEKIKGIKNKKKHPYEFYQKVGYQIVGVIPDANGIGKPDIWMAKSISKISGENLFI
jgi:aminoglycoside 6'-N-acetyltransferase I